MVQDIPAALHSHPARGAAIALLVTCACAIPAAAAALQSNSPLADFRAFAQDRPRACPPHMRDAAAPPAPWRAGDTVCVWRGLLAMRRWHAPAGATPGCTGAPARYWAWMRTRFGQPMRAQSMAWHLAWRANAVRAADGQTSHVSTIERNEDGSWTATQWSWTPSEREATRAWQQGRWVLLQQAAAALQPPPLAAAAPETALVLSAWEDALRGRPAETDGATWRWQGDGACVALDTIGRSTAQIQMPYNESEGRREQRAAMQLLLARRHPGADWIAPFSQLPRVAGSRGGAKYSALWRADYRIHGQLWIPREGEQSTIRIRITALLPQRLSDTARAAHVFRGARAVNTEIAAIAAAWDMRHER